MTTPVTQKEISAAYGERVLVELPAVEVFLSWGCKPKPAEFVQLAKRVDPTVVVLASIPLS